MLNLRKSNIESTLRTAKPSDRDGAGYCHAIGSLQGKSDSLDFVLNNLQNELTKDKQ